MKTNFDFNIGRKICTRIANGESLQRICADYEWSPKRQETVRKWYREIPEFQKMLDQAYVDRSDFYTEKMFDIMEKIERGEIKPNVGKVLLDEYRWLATKIHPLFLERKEANLQIDGGAGGVQFNIVLADVEKPKQITHVVDAEEIHNGMCPEKEDARLEEGRKEEVT